MVEVFRKNAQLLNESLIGTTQLILLEDVSKRSPNEIYGRNDGFTKVIIPNSNGISIGDYVAVDIVDGNSQVLKGKMIEKVSLSEFHENR
jgi:filamentous hemagglutinin family protein